MVIRQALAAYLIAAPLACAAPHYTIVPAQSSLTFTAIQNGAPVSGHFGMFTGDIRFDPASLGDSSVTVTVVLASVASDTEGMASTLAEAGWFDTARFPTAQFASQRITALGEGTYAAEGILTLKGVSKPLTLPFTLTAYDKAHAKASGEVELTRTDFHVGWEETRQVKDAVTVHFTVIATAKEN